MRSGARRLAVLLCAWLCAAPAVANPTNTTATSPLPTLIVAGNTFQQLLPVVSSGADRLSLLIQNNQTTLDNCWVIINGPWQAGDTVATIRAINGVSMTAKQAAILLLPGGSYSRYYPFIPSDRILGTCASTGGSLYVDTQ